MKILIASDLHGSAPAAHKLLERFEAEKADKLLFLGDVLYHGPRNDLPAGYNTKEVCALLNPYAGRILAVQGNCDAEVDQWVLDFPLLNTSLKIEDAEQGVSIFATHGHREGMNPSASLERLGKLDGRCVIATGHTHVKVLEQRDNLVFVNPGSLSIPKDDGPGYAIYENAAVELKDLAGTSLAKITL